MSDKRVLWFEGMELLPQHFQKQDSFHEYQRSFCLWASSNVYWGLLDFEISQNDLGLGFIKISRAKGILPVGTTFDIGSRQTIESLNLNHFEKAKEVYLAVPLEKNGNLIANDKDSEDSEKSPFLAEDGDVFDNTTGDFQAENLRLGTPNLQIITDIHDLKNYSYCKIARLADRKADGSIVLDTSFLVPSLRIGATENFKTFAFHIMNLVNSKADSIRKRLGTSRSISSTTDIIYLQSLWRFLSSIQSESNVVNMHPSDFYEKMNQLVSDVAVCAGNYKVLDQLEDYHHDNPEASFSKARELLQKALDMALEKNVHFHEIIDLKYGLKHCAFASEKIFEEASFFLQVSGNLAEDALIQRINAMLKIGPMDQITQIVSNQISGIPFQLVQTLPKDLPYHSGSLYFRLDKNSSYWPMLASSSNMAFHMGGEIPGLNLGLWTVKEND